MNAVCYAGNEDTVLCSADASGVIALHNLTSGQQYGVLKSNTGKDLIDSSVRDGFVRGSCGSLTYTVHSLFCN